MKTEEEKKEGIRNKCSTTSPSLPQVMKSISERKNSEWCKGKTVSDLYTRFTVDNCKQRSWKKRIRSSEQGYWEP